MERKKSSAINPNSFPNRKQGIFVTEDFSGKKNMISSSPRKTRKIPSTLSASDGNAGISDHMSSCNSDYAPSSHSGNSSSSAYTD